MKELTDPDFINTIETGNDILVLATLAKLIDPITTTLFERSGEDIAKALPAEVIFWLKDTILLWIKNKGVGHEFVPRELCEEKELREKVES